MAAGYSGTPQARKLGLKAGQRVTLDEPPDGWSLREPPSGLRGPDADGAADLIVAFFRAEAEIAARLPSLARRVFPAGAVWAAWPRRAAGHDSDITDNVVRSLALELGLVDVKVAAIDEDWSGLRLVWRVNNRLGRSRHGGKNGGAPGYSLVTFLCSPIWRAKAWCCPSSCPAQSRPRISRR